VGQIVVLDCGLHPDYPEKTPTQLELIESEWIDQLIKPRRPFAHKGDYGHAALFAGSPGMAGAAILAARACMRSGVGKLTCYVPEPLIPILQIGCPEAMCRLYQPSRSEKPSGSEKLTGSEKPTGWVKSSEELSALARYSAIGVGPGWGTSEQSRITLENLLRNYDSPLVIDADALNLISLYPQLSKHIPLNSILTPHPAEFERFAGKSDNDYKRIERALEIARDWQVIIILKGHHSFIATPGGKGYFNITGNPGMATAGSGDVLTGILTGLLAQGYSPLETAIAGVYLHGRAGDLAAEQRGMASLIASDIVENLRIGIR
jgi:hydroxyethylthiazole kinase-like uncharacterized protein yjeF